MRPDAEIRREDVVFETVDRHFDISWDQPTDEVALIFDRDHPENRPIMCRASAGDFAAIEREIYRLMDEERANEDRQRHHSWFHGVDVGRDPQLIEHTFYGPDSHADQFHREYMAEPLEEVPAVTPGLIEEQERRARDDYRRFMDNYIANRLNIPSPTQPAPNAQNLTPGAEVFSHWVSDESSSVSGSLVQQLARMDRDRETQRQRTRRNRNYLTWMPYSSYRKCAACFEDSDLKHMRVNILRTLRYLERNSRPTRHKAVELWRGFEQSLIRYGIAIALECRQRGFSDTSLVTLRSKYRHGYSQKPDWVYWTDLQESHRAYLLLRNERRFAVKLLGHYARRTVTEWCSHRDFCHNIGIRAKREWTVDDINTIRHVMGDVSGGNINLVNDNFYRQYGWTQEPTESFRYPQDNLCSA
ncbi:MAG: pyrimidine dimer DNA glycosylase/endonuclease V [Candidatus Omnitrophota bacterium]|jgi:hypothetical protein